MSATATEPKRPRRERTPQRQRAAERHWKTIRAFVEVYCRENHGLRDASQCKECSDLLDYAQRRIDKCPYDPKPKCKECPTHCYHAWYRERMREVMRFSGLYFVKRGRLDWLIRYFLWPA